MALSVSAVAPARALDALGAVIGDLQGGDALAPVTVVVPTNASGVMARRALGRRGLVGVDMVTLNRLAELLGGPTLAAERRRPSSTPVLDLAVRRVLDHAPGMYRPVASHPSTTVALRDLHLELRLAGPSAAAALQSTRRGSEVVRVSRAVTAALAPQWYDEADLYARATELVDHDGFASAVGTDGRLRRVVVYLPGELAGLARSFLRALAGPADVRVVVTAVGDAAADHEVSSLVQALTGELVTPVESVPPSSARPRRIVSTTDADDEVRVAVRAVVDAARGADGHPPVPFHRVALLWPTHRPYARLVEHHLTVAGIPWNGPSGTSTAERVVPRLVLDLLDVDRRGLRRHDLFDLLADVPARRDDGAPLQTAEWERVARYAGLHRGDDWEPRLSNLREHARWGEAATELGDFVRRLRDTLGHPAGTRSWWDWATWCDEQIEAWIGRATVNRLPDVEYRAVEALDSALERLRHLDGVGEPVTRHRFRTVLEAELDASSPRQGRVGDGVAVGSLAGAAGLDVDVAVVLGGAEGVLPPAPAADPLLSDADRARAGLVSSDATARRLLHQFRAITDRARCVVTMPRGDLRATTVQQPSRWIGGWLDDHDAVPYHAVPSHVAGLATVAFPASPLEHRLRGRLHDRHGVADDTVLHRALALSAAHQLDALTVFDGDLSTAGVPPLAGPVSPTQIETWVACPHAYFVRYLLGVRPLDERGGDLTINALERGSVQHEVLDRFHRDVIAGRLDPPGAEGWTSAHRDALLVHFDEVCEASERRGRTGRPASWAGERERMRDDLQRWLHHDAQMLVRRGATPIASEHDFSPRPDRPDQPVVSVALRDGRRLPVLGVIDRLDRCADGSYVVTDHKTGRADRYRKLGDLDPTLGATVFQLPAYAAAARVLAGVPDAVVHAEYSMFGLGQYGRHGVTFTDEVWERVVDDLSHVVAGIESGWFPARPDKPGFQFYVACHYCQPDGLGTHDSYDRWRRKHRDPRLDPWFASPDPTPSAETDGAGT